MRRKPGRRGAVLIVVMGVLVVLALLATTFATMQSLERQVARNYLDGVRAKQLARSGVEFAYSRLVESLNSGQLGNAQFLKALKYFGKDNNEIGTNPLLVNASLEEASCPSLAVESLAGSFGPLETPQNPTDANFAPRNIWLRTPSGVIPVGFSGIMDSGSYGQYGDFFALNVRDASGMIYVNDGITESQTFGSVSKNLRRILNRLGQTVSPPIVGLGDTIINNRPSTGYKSKRELVSVLGLTNYNRVASFLTSHAWVDTNVPNPVPLSADAQVVSYYNQYWPGMTIGTSGANGIYYRGPIPRYRYGRSRNSSNGLVPGYLRMTGSPMLASPGGNDAGVYAMDELFPQWIEMTSRAPVNLNAAPKEVLMALLSDVHGFWVCERRRDNPPSALSPYYTAMWNDVTQTYDATGVEGDQFGYLYTSDPIKAPGISGQNSADWIADEIIACRNGAASPHATLPCNYGNPAQAPFGGAFRSWRQFYMFCDNLVDIGVVNDTRTGLYYYHNYPAMDKWGYNGGPLNSNSWANTMYDRLGSMAVADAIKANFNPNLHLNEANPDENMSLMIDKTDLIVMSTEGTFVPTGYYEIESLGRVVRPVGGNPPNALNTTAANPADLIAEFKVEAVVKLYNAIRFTSQRDFYGAGASGVGPANYKTVQVATSLPVTNNGLSLEIGPEPDHGIAPEQNRWGGYIAWPTNYGEFGLGQWKRPGTYGLNSSTPSPDPGQSGCNSGITGCIMHNHFFRSDMLYHHMQGQRNNLTKVAVAGEVNECFPDRTEPTPGPYSAQQGPDPISASAGNRYRLARDFRVPNAAGSGSLPGFQEIASLDQRIDGMYLERHSTLAYWIEAASIGAGTYHRDYHILFSYWIKPKYYPEVSGKLRQYFNWSRMDPRGDIMDINSWYNPMGHHPYQKAHYFAPSQNPGYENWMGPIPGSWMGWPGDYGKYSPVRPASYIYLDWHSFATLPYQYCPSICFLDGMNCAASETLNHHLHDAAGYPACQAGMPKRRINPASNTRQPYYLLRNPLASGRWNHFIFYWRGDYDMNNSLNGWTAPPYRRMVINGIPHGTSNAPSAPSHPIAHANGWVYDEYGRPHPEMDWTFHTQGMGNVGGSYGSGAHNVCLAMPSIYTSDRCVVRIGETDRWSTVQPGASPTAPSISGGPNNATRNFAPDSTIDEFYMFRGTKGNSATQEGQQTAMVNMFRQGRYHLPRNANEGQYDSPTFSLPSIATTLRVLPPPSAVPPPSGMPAPPPVGAGVTSSAKIIGMNWTWFGETVDLADVTSTPADPNTLDPVLTDYNTLTTAVGGNPATIKPMLQTFLYVDSVWYGPYVNELFSAVQTASGAPVPVISPNGLRFRFRFTWYVAPPAAAYILATPYIDDITIYFDGGDAGFVDYHMS